MHEPRRVLCVTKPRYIGDTVLATPAMRALSTSFPSADMELMTGAAAAEVMQGCPWFTHTIVLQRRKRRHLTTVVRQASMLRARKYDTALLFDRSLRSAILARLAGIPVRAGFAVEMRRPLLTHPVRYDKNKHEVDCLLSVSEAVGARSHSKRVELWVSEVERKVCEGYGLHVGQYVCFACGANEPELRLWPPEHFVAVGNALSLRGYRIILVGSKEEAHFAEPVARGLKEPPLNLTGRTSLREALGLIASAAVYLSAETGLSHCAVALNTPSIVIHGPTKWQRWGHRTDTAIALWTDAQSPRPSIAEVQGCLRAVVPEIVLEAISLLLRERSFAT